MLSDIHRFSYVRIWVKKSNYWLDFHTVLKDDKFLPLLRPQKLLQQAPHPSEIELVANLLTLRESKGR